MVVPVAGSATSIASTSFTANWTAPAIGTVDNYLLDVSTSKTFSSFVTGYNGLNVAAGSTSANIYRFKRRYKLLFPRQVQQN